MRLRKIKIQNFRKLNDVEINLGDTTFLIGANNAGKSSTLDIIEYLVTDKKLDNSCRSKYIEDGEELTKKEDVIIEGCFDNVDSTIVNQRGFNASRLKSTQTSGNNKRIAKNTLLLNFRKLFMMVVSLYTIRVIMNAYQMYFLLY